MEDTIALSSRIRLARNYEDFAFPSRMNQELAQSVLDRTMQSLQASPDLGVPHMVRMQTCPSWPGRSWWSNTASPRNLPGATRARWWSCWRAACM